MAAAKPTHYVVSGYPECPFYRRALAHVSQWARKTALPVTLFRTHVFLPASTSNSAAHGATFSKVELPREQYHNHRREVLKVRTRFVYNFCFCLFSLLTSPSSYYLSVAFVACLHSSLLSSMASVLAGVGP